MQLPGCERWNFECLISLKDTFSINSFLSCLKCNFFMNHHVLLMVGWLVGLSLFPERAWSYTSMLPSLEHLFLLKLVNTINSQWMDSKLEISIPKYLPTTMLSWMTPSPYTKQFFNFVWTNANSSLGQYDHILWRRSWNGVYLDILSRKPRKDTYP